MGFLISFYYSIFGLFLEVIPHMTTKYIKRCLSTAALFAGLTLQAQNNIKPAIQEFDKSNYKGAIAYIEPQLDKLERDAKANYYLGASYVAANTNISEGIRRLKYAQIKGFVANSYYYLGRAYQLSFEYESAVQAFERFLKTARDQELIAQAQQWRTECLNSMPLASKIFNVRVIDKYRITPDSLLYVYNPSKEVGQVQYNRDFFESDIDPNGILYQTERGDVVFFSLSDSEGKESLYKIERLLDGWGDMIPLSGLENQASNKTPVMMTDGTTLYFSSNREGGMGGYDIYRTTYDLESRTFTQPVNMGVPFNSAFDDYLFVGDEFRTRAWFASNRETSVDSVMVYEILWNESVIRSFAQSTEEIRKASALDIDPTLAEMRDNMEKTTGGKHTASFSVTKEADKFNFQINDSLTYTQWEHFRSEAAKLRFSQAYTVQNEKDSLWTTMGIKRKSFMETPSDDERNAIIAEVLKIERHVYELEDRLKEMYDEVRKTENAALSELIASGNYTPLNKLQVKKPAMIYDWNALLKPDNYEMYSDVLFESSFLDIEESFNILFNNEERDELIEADSLYAWAGVLTLEAEKLREKALNNVEVTITDEQNKSIKLSYSQLSERIDYLLMGSNILYNKALDQMYNIIDDRYGYIIDNQPSIDFSEIEPFKKSAERDFGLVERTKLEDGAEELTKAIVLKKRGVKSLTSGLGRLASHVDGSFPFPEKRQPLAEPFGVTSALAAVDSTTAKRGDELFTFEASDLNALPAKQDTTSTPASTEAVQPSAAPTETAQPEAPAKQPAPTNLPKADEQQQSETSAQQQAVQNPAADKPVYRIQLGVYRNKPNAQLLEQFEIITTQAIPDRGLTKYFEGEYKTYKEAYTALVKVKNNGFAGAFIVAFLNGNQIKLSEAQKLE